MVRLYRTITISYFFHKNNENQRLMKNNKQHIIAAALWLFSATAALAADPEPAKAAASDQFGTTMQWLFLGTIGVLTAVVAYVVMQTMRLYQDLLSTAIAKEQGKEVAAVILERAKTNKSWLDKAYFQLFGTGAVAIEKEADIMIDHPHDGIYELDNRLPPWWVSMFYATIVFAFGYLFYYHYLYPEQNQLAEYTESVRKADILKADVAERQANLVNEKSVVALTDKKDLSAGQDIFIGKCAACHGQKGEGGVGPNMTDEYWLHGGGIKNVFSTVKYGVPDKGMISWQGQLSAKEIQNVSSYILTLKGTNPPNPKAPQGTIYTEEAAGAAGDSTGVKTDTTKAAAPAKVGK